MEAFVLIKMKITYNTMKSKYPQKIVWKCGCQIFIMYLNFIAPDFTQMSFNSKRFICRTCFVSFEIRWPWELFIFIFVFSVSSKLT